MSTLIEYIPATGLQVSDDFTNYAWNRLGVDNQQFKPIINRLLPIVKEIEEPCTFGVFSRRLTQSKITLLERTSSVDVGGEYSSATKLSRLYLDYYHPNSIRTFGSQARAIQRLSKSVPLYVNPCTLKDASYVDIKSMYFTTLVNLGWNLDFYPDVWLTAGRAPLDFPLKDAKVPRAYLVTQCLPATYGTWNGKDQISYRSIHNVHLHYGLVTCTMAILHSVAQYAIQNCHASYVHTDGMIVPTEYSEKLIKYIRLWGYQAIVKHHGETIIKAMGNFLCGERKTLGFDPSKASIATDSVDYTVNRIWMLNQVDKAIQLGVAERLYRKSLGDYNR